MDVSFNEEPLASRSYAASGRTRGLYGLVIKLGLAQDEKEAVRMLLIAVVLLVCVAAAVLLFGGPDGPPEVLYEPGQSAFGR